jgi:HSP20 family protein
MLMQWKTTPAPFFNDFLTRQMDGVFRELFPAPKARAPRRGVNVSESEEAFTLTAALPGMSPEDLSLEVANGTLELKASRSTKAPEGYRALRRERGALSIERSFRLGAKIDTDAIEATFEHGLLTVTLPKRAAAQPRQIAINAA